MHQPLAVPWCTPQVSPYESKLLGSLVSHLVNVKVPLEVLPYVKSSVFVTSDGRKDGPTKMVKMHLHVHASWG